MATKALSQSEERGCRKLSSIFDIPPSKRCHRCNETVYHAEKIGPIKDVVFHRSCFKCAFCGQHLTIKNYLTSQANSADREVYCQAHAGKTTGKGLDGRALGIKGALNSQNMYRRATHSDINHSAPLMDTRALGIKRALTVPKMPGQYNEQIHGTRRGPHIDSNAMYIKGAINAQDLRAVDRVNGQNLPYQFPAVIHKKREEIINAQKNLEEHLRAEEDELYKEFKNEREEEAHRLKKELNDEWESRLKELTEKFERDHGKKMKKMKDSERKAMTVHLNQQKGELQKTIDEKKKRKQQYMTLKIIEKEQALTTDLVKKHSEQMLALLAEKKREAEVEIQQELMRAREQELQENGNSDETTEDIIMQENLILQEALEYMGPATTLAPTELPPPKPPAFRKRDLYHDVVVFNDLDEHVFGIAEGDHNSWTDLIHQLTANCLSDLEKARAIFRWITVKDLNMMEFDETVDSDTPLGILRGIKYGTETYHVLFMRMCSYAGLHCTEIKGKSKSVGYEPGMKFKEDLFNNTWNAVLIDGEWRLIQCNWGARHLVLNKDQESKAASAESKSKRKDKIRYQYDEHYFLTDPDEFILEFMAAEPQWQLLERPISQEEFQQLPFVRSVFFHYGMKFMDSPRAVLRTNSKGGTEIKIRIPEQHIRDVVFHYQLRFAEKERRQDTDYKGAKLERFVFQTMLDDHVVYSIHVPTSGEYFLEIFANKIDDSHRVGDDPNSPMMPFRLKCACKFRVICDSLQNKMHPLPCCAAGEWGPTKAIRHFDLLPISHRVGVISPQTDRIEIKFKIPRPLHFLAKLRKNGIDDHALDRFIDTSVSGEQLTVSVLFPEAGQYGLDLYARPERAADSQILAHACKYLINVEKVSQTIELDVTKVDAATLMSKDKWGPLPAFDKFGMKAITHKDPRIKISESNQLTIEMSLSERLQISYHLIREPDEDHREHVTVARNDETRKAKFFINLLRPGSYLLAIYAKQDLDSSMKMVNVYNYLIKYSPPETSSHSGKDKKSKK